MADRDGYLVAAEYLRFGFWGADPKKPTTFLVVDDWHRVAVPDDLIFKWPDRICVRCGRPATGWALGPGADDWLCHGDNEPSPTCYELAQGEFWWDPDKWEATKARWEREREH